MAENANVNINLNSKADLKGFKQAETASSKLAKSAKKLGVALGLAYSAKAIVSYSKAAMMAASQDQKAQKILTNSLKNVGLAYAAVDAESFIQSMEKQTAILDDDLRPAYSQLAQVTGSVKKTQDLMGLAFDVSSGSGLDYASTVDILSQAYVGNTKGLKQLNLGLTQAELKAMSFDEIQTKLKTNFAGAGGVALDTYAGSMAKLSVATSNASETIGGALLDAVVKVTGSKGIDGLISKVDTLAGSIASVITQIGNMVGALNGTEAQKAFSPGFMISGGRAGSFRTNATGAGNMAMSVQSQDLQKSSAAAAKTAEALAKKRANELLAITKKSTKAAADAAKAKAIADKKSADLSKAAAVFDLSRISIAAALRATYDNETKLRLLAMQAIEEDDGKTALGYLGQLKILQDSVQAAKLAGVTTISNASLAALNTTLLAELAAIDKTKMDRLAAIELSGASQATKDKEKLAAIAAADAASAAAFTKYNDALTKQGGLAAANAYAELTQIQLTSIAKLAAIAKTGAALATLNTIMVSNELAIATTQSANDLARYSALQDYITLLGVAYNAAIALAQANAAAGVAAVNAANNLAAALAANAAAAASAASSAPAAARDAEIGAGAYPSLPGDSLGDSSIMPGGDSSIMPGGDIPIMPDPDYGGALSGINLNPPRSREDDFSGGGDTIIVNTGATLGTEQAIVEAVQTAIQTLNRRGGNTQYAGAIA